MRGTHYTDFAGDNFLGQPPKLWQELVEENYNEYHLSSRLAQSRDAWRMLKYCEKINP